MNRAEMQRLHLELLDLAAEAKAAVRRAEARGDEHQKRYAGGRYPVMVATLETDLQRIASRASVLAAGVQWELEQSEDDESAPVGATTEAQQAR